MGSILVAGCLALTSACTTTSDRVLDSDQNQLKLRSIQTKAFDTGDRTKTIRAAIATLQDLGFVLDKADEALGVLSGTKLNGYELRMTVAIRQSGAQRITVRASGQFNLLPITDPLPYQNFFTALEKAMFLQAQQVD